MCQHSFIAKKKNLAFAMERRKHTKIIFCSVEKKKGFKYLFNFPVFKGSALNKKPHSVAPAFACFWC